MASEVAQTCSSGQVQGIEFQSIGTSKRVATRIQEACLQQVFTEFASGDSSVTFEGEASCRRCGMRFCIKKGQIPRKII